ncbi:MAG: hypothetical protein VYD05_05780 [Planctomycetota bacterium]|nr:hypothetical protein [Planctomycetota bacterium]
MRDWIVAAHRAALIIVALLTAPCAGQTNAEATATFRNYNRTFQLELPANWRQVAPGEAVQVSERAGSPPVLWHVSPRQFYGVGAVDDWLRGDFSATWLYVHEQRDEWHVEDDFAATLEELWRKHGEANGVTHELRDVHLERIGTQRVECIVATRTTTPPPPASPRMSLDVHAPTAKQQITLSFTASPEAFDRWRPEFERWLSTLTFARVAEKPTTIAERLWTPLLVGAVVGLVLVLLYRYTRTRR